MLSDHAPELALLHLRRDRRRHPGRQLVLQLEEVGGGAGEAVGPDRRAALAVAELGRQAHLVAGAVHAAGQHVAHGKLAPHALRLVHLAAIAQHRGAADHDQLGQARQRRDDGFDQPVGEPRGAAVLGLVDERQHGDRGPPALEAVDDRRCPRPEGRAGPRRRRRAAARPDGIGVHRPGHVAQLERPQLLDRLLEAAGDQVHHRRRHQHAADRRMLLQARHDVDAVAQKVGALDGDLAHVDGAAQLEPHRRARRDGRLRHRRLHGQCGARGVDRADELDQQPVAQRLEDAPAARCDQRIDRLAQRAPRAQHALLVGLDEGAEIDDVERHDHDQPAAAVRGVAGARFRTLASHA